MIREPVSSHAPPQRLLGAHCVLEQQGIYYWKKYHQRPLAVWSRRWLSPVRIAKGGGCLCTLGVNVVTKEVG